MLVRVESRKRSRFLQVVTARSAAALAVVGAMSLLPCGSSGSASALATTSGKGYWMIKTNDLSELPSGLQSQWNVVGCGITALKGWTLPPTAGEPAVGPCASGQDRIFTSYTGFQSAVSSGQIQSGGTIIYDLEKWIYTPKVERADRTLYETMAGELAAKDGIHIIYTPQGTPGTELNSQFKVAAKFGAMIEIQSQFWQSNPVKFKNDVSHILSIIRASNPTVPVLLGFSSDPNGVPAKVADMLKSYRLVFSKFQGLQLNLPQWTTGSGCAATGCPSIGVSFLNGIGN